MAKKTDKVKKEKKDKIKQILKDKGLDGITAELWTTDLETMTGEEASQHLIEMIKAKEKDETV